MQKSKNVKNIKISKELLCSKMEKDNAFSGNLEFRF
jgi:hypothetical protein